MSQRFAAETTVPVEKTRTEIERLLQRYGATQFLSAWDERRAVIAFTMEGRQVRFSLPLPHPDDPDIARTLTGKTRTSLQRQAAWEQECRRRWRALLLVIKAKLESVASGVEVFEDAFLAQIVLPSGATVGQWAGPQLREVYASGQMPALLPGATLAALGPGE